MRDEHEDACFLDLDAKARGRADLLGEKVAT
jgi:hypothetical protein